MAEADFTAFTAANNQALDDGSISKGVTTAFSPPNGGGSFVFGFHSLQAVIGVAGMYASVTDFNPIAPGKGGSIRAAIRRYASGSDYAPMIGFISGTNVQTSPAYILGLSGSDPYQIVLRKGYLIGGLDPSGSDILRRSDESFASNALWFHLRMDVVINPHGDVVINIMQNDLGSNAVTSPGWSSIPGMEAYTDDSLGVLSGTAPLVSGGFRGFMAHFNNGTAGRVSLIDHLELYRQITP